jgi:diguanylate cyclase (GGDEF)-like protein
MNESGGEFPKPTRKAQLKHLDKFRETHQRQEHIKKLSLTDALMGIWNRRALLGDGDSGEIKGGYFIPHLTREIAEARRTPTPLSIIILDLDLFKKLNDILTHLGGDTVLRATAKLLSTHIRTSDIIGRYGGEELLIILPETDLKGAIKEAERLRQLMETNEIEFNNTKVKVTSSFGVAQLKDSHGQSKDLILEADRNLYRAKKGGRNQVFPPPPIDPNPPV